MNSPESPDNPKSPENPTKKPKTQQGLWNIVVLAIALSISNQIAINSALGQSNPDGVAFPKLSVPLIMPPEPTSTSMSTPTSTLTTPPSQKQKQKKEGMTKINTSIKSSEIPKLLGQHKKAIADWYNIPDQKFDKMCQNDKCVKIDQNGRLFHACAGLALNPEEAERIIAQNNTDIPLVYDYDIEIDMAFELESMPGAQRTIYLDFDGHITKGTFWNNTDRPEIVHPAMDLFTPGVGLTPDYFTEHELRAIINIWKQVCEDFSPYEVNVTTKEPPLDKLIKSNNTDQEYGIRVVIGGDGRNFLSGSYGGIAYVGSFSWENDTPTFAFSDNLGRVPKYIAEVISHEVGHTAGLWHHGRTDGATYHTGDGIWAPIMGATYAARVGQWCKGEYPLANNKNPDMEIMSGYMPFKNDIEAMPNYNPTLGKDLYGTIHKPYEVDSFFLELKGGTVTIRVELPEYFPNTDLCMNLKDKDGNTLYTYKFYPSPFISIDVKKGDYILELFGATFAGAGNSSYGSTGQYKLSVTQDSVIPHITNADLIQDNDQIVVSNLETDPPKASPSIDYSWEVASYNAPQNFQKIEGLTSPKLNINAHDLVGKYIRGKLTPITGGKENTSFTTRAFKVLATPPQEVIAKEFFEFSSTLELSKDTQQEKNIIINELSQGHRFGENPEWIELLVLKESDLRGLQFKTKYNGILKFKDTPTWSKIPEGTIIVVYNGNEKDPLIGEDKFLPYTERLIIASSTDSSLFEGVWAKLKAPQNIIAFQTGFEANEKTTYAKSTVNIDGRNWILDDALIGTDPKDMKEGLKSLRMRNGLIETQDYLKEGIKEISFLYSRANFSGDRSGTSPTFEVYYSKREDPNTWVPIATRVTILNDELASFNAPVGHDGDYKIRIAKVSGTKDKRWNIDNLKITESETMNFIQVLDNRSSILKELHFGYSEKAIGNEFLLPNITESFSSSNPSEISDENKWMANTWAKNSTAITPGKGNSPENLELIRNLSSEVIGNLPTYWLENYPEGLEIETTTGRIFGSIPNGGYYKIQVHNSNTATTQHEIIPILVKQSFADAFASRPDIANNPQGDHNNNGIANIVEFALGEDAITSSSILNLAEIANLTEDKQPMASLKGVEQEDLALSITYTRNKIAYGLRIQPEWSTNLKAWSSEHVQSKVLEDLGDKERVISWVPINTNMNINAESQAMFIRISIKED